MTLDFRESPEAESLRDQLRTMIADLLPEEFVGGFTDNPADMETTKAFCREMGSRGLISLSWPSEYGGQERDTWQQMALREEMWANYEPRGAQYMNVNLGGSGADAFWIAGTEGSASVGHRCR